MEEDDVDEFEEQPTDPSYYSVTTSDPFLEERERRRRQLEEQSYGLSAQIQRQAYGLKRVHGPFAFLAAGRRRELENLKESLNALRQQRHAIIEEEKEHRRMMADAQRASKEAEKQARRAEAEYRKVETLQKQLKDARIAEQKAREDLRDTSERERRVSAGETPADFAKQHAVTVAEKNLRKAERARDDIEKEVEERLKKVDEAAQLIHHGGWAPEGWPFGQPYDEMKDPETFRKEQREIEHLYAGEHRGKGPEGEEAYVPDPRNLGGYGERVADVATRQEELEERRGQFGASQANEAAALEARRRSEQAALEKAEAARQDYEAQLRSYGVDPMGAPTPAPPRPAPPPAMPQPRPGGMGGGARPGRQGGAGTGIPSLNINPQQTSLNMPTGGLLGMLGKGLGGIGQGIGGMMGGIGQLFGGGGKGPQPGGMRGPQIGPGGPPLPPRRPAGLGTPGAAGAGGLPPGAALYPPGTVMGPPMPGQPGPGQGAPGQAMYPPGSVIGPPMPPDIQARLPPGAFSPQPFGQQGPGAYRPIRGSLDAIPPERRTGLLGGMGQTPFQRTPMPPQRPGTATEMARGGGQSSLKQMIDAEAARRGIDPRQMYGIVAGESLHKGTYDVGDKGRSFGPYQMYMGGGMGNELARRGIDVRDPRTLPQQTAAVADYVARHGLRPNQAPWYGYHGARDWDPKWGTMGAGGGGGAPPTAAAAGGGGGVGVPIQRPQQREQPQQPQQPQDQQPPMPPPRPPQRGEVQDGHMFMGGNPADRNNWQKAPGGQSRRPQLKRPERLSGGALGRLHPEQQRWGMGMQ